MHIRRLSLADVLVRFTMHIYTFLYMSNAHSSVTHNPTVLHTKYLSLDRLSPSILVLMSNLRLANMFK